MRKFRTPYDEDYSPHNYAVTISDEVKAQQHFKNDCDINQILEKHRLGLPVMQVKVNPIFDEKGEYLEAGDYQDALEKVIKADAAFAELPAKIRKYYNNSPAEYLQGVISKDQILIDAGAFTQGETTAVPSKLDVMGMSDTTPAKEEK